MTSKGTAYEARTAGGLTQAELAAMVGTRQSVIARLEATDYGGHSLNMLRRIATALNQRVRVEFYTPGVPPVGEAAQTD